MKFVLFLSLIFITFHTFCQEELNPALYTPFSKDTKSLKRSSESFDSTFIYKSDTLSLPFFDDFSKNHFQKYTADFSNPTVTFDEKFKLVDLSNVPLANSSRFTSQKTYKRVFNNTQQTFTDEFFPAQKIKVGDFSSYPPVYTQTDVYPPYVIFDTIEFPATPDTLWLSDVEFVQDSAVQFFAQLNNKNAFWLDAKATHNYTNAVNPWTLGVVTFDGTNEFGLPYQFGSNSIDFNDYLTSKAINLNGLSGADSVYLSFLYQPQGYNDEPENVDSLILEYYAPVLDQWFQIWSVGGTALHDFKKVHLRLLDAKFFKSTFQFRFKNYSSVAGALDQFHIDYVRLKASSGYQDTIFKDFSVLYPLNTLLDDFTQVPWEHFKNNPLGKTSKNLKTVVRSSSNVVENYLDGNIKVVNQGLLDGTFNILGQDLAAGDNNYLPNKVYETFHDISAFYDFNSSLTGNLQEFDVAFSATAQFSNFSGNDTTYFKQRFYDVYAYDDGSAEAAYGPTGVQARLAYKFTPYENDSLVGVKIKFVPSVNDVSKDLFLLTVWDDNAGKPGNVIYEDDFLNPRTPNYNYDDSLGFRNYYLIDYQKLPITGTFYVGWRQLDQRALNIGFDRNTIQSNKIFYSTNNGVTWANTQYPGSLMMRPIFATQLNKSLAVNEIRKEKTPQLKVYPNPFSDFLRIESSSIDFSGVKVSDVGGKILLESKKEEKILDVSFLKSGIYFIQDNSSGEVLKMIKN